MAQFIVTYINFINNSDTMCILPFYRASEIIHGCKIALFGSEQIIKKKKTQWLIIFKTFDKSINKLSFFHMLRDANKYIFVPNTYRFIAISVQKYC